MKQNERMSAMLIRLDPTLPLCWESLETLRIGFDRAEVRLHHPSARAQRFIALLQEGLLSSEFTAASRRIGLHARERSSLLDALSPVLLRTPIGGSGDRSTQRSPHRVSARTPQGARSERRSVTVTGEGHFAHALRDGLRRAGFDLPENDSKSDSESDEEAGFAVLVDRFLGPATRAHELLISDIPHLPIRLTDRSMLIGPIVGPGGRPCLSCVELHEQENDPLLPALAAQLLQVRPGAETAASAELASALIATLLKRWWTGMPELTDSRLRFAVREGIPETLPTVEAVLPHPSCGCVSLAQAA